ncbi:SIR2 family protein [Desulfofundulus thermosubterraneus]|nr:SIR2 family protein [Desulfofundulus thermosubterraneus]
MVVPFIGAGVSIDAKHRGGIAGLTNTRCMCERVLQALREKCQTRDRVHCTSCVVRKEIESNPKKEISFDKACELWEWSCSGDRGGGTCRRCELVREILKIPEFANVEPADAHYYIAFLAREGLIDEVITTNYDTCIEDAYCKTFGFSNALESADSPALVIGTLAEYRSKGGKRFANGMNKRRCLKVYKINGCASRLCASRVDDCHGYCKNILLTERDLQDWGKRGWARDLFRDRLRSRALLFSGFGSDEPQVRHTALQVCEEFASEERDNATNRSHNSDTIWEKPNAPFIVAYVNTLSFSQAQIMRAYAPYEDVSLSPEKTNSNAFLGSDVQFFDAGGSSDKQQLEADLFWKRLFQAAFWRLLRRACGRESAIVSFLQPVLLCAPALLIEALDWFTSRNEAECIFGRFPEMLNLAEDRGRMIPLARWVERVRTIQPEFRSGLYHPLVDRPVLIPAVLLLIYLIIGNNHRKSDISWEELRAKINDDDGPLGLSIDGCHMFGDAGVRLYIAHRNVAEQLPQKVVCHGHKEMTVAIQIVVNPWRARTRRVHLVDGKGNRVKVVTVRQISILELFGHATSVPEAIKRFRERLRTTFLLIDPGRARVHHRSKPLRSWGDEDGR